MRRAQALFALAPLVVVVAITMARDDETPTNERSSDRIVAFVDHADVHMSAPSGVSVAMIPAGAILVIGSLDLTGAAHSLHIRFDDAEFDRIERCNVAESPFPSSEARWWSRRGGNEGPRYVGEARNSGFTSNDRQVTDFESQISNLKSVPPHPLPRWPMQANGESLLSGEGTSRAVDIAPVHRHFLAPRFEDAQAASVPVTGKLYASNAVVTVYVDDNGTALRQLKLDAQLASAVCDELQSGTLELIQHWIGPIADLDGDGRLTVLLTDLDRRTRVEDTPIEGCVRATDFATPSVTDALAGDIIYLDRRVGTHREATTDLRTLLAHEVTHAAIYSRAFANDEQRGASTDDVPAWLNEALAHVIEVRSGTPRLTSNTRVEQFQSQPERCPIVADERHVPFAVRRGGCRTAAALFLEPLIDDPEDVDTLLRDPGRFDQAVAELSGQSFANAFRNWSTAMASRIEPTSRLNMSDRYTVNGTAFLAIRIDKPMASLTVDSDCGARLQVTIIEP